MKFGILAALRALHEADEHLRGTVPADSTLGNTLLTLVRRYRSQQESARTMRNGIQALKHELNEAQQSETKALARLDGAISAADNLRAQIVALIAERDAVTEESAKSREAYRLAFDREIKAERARMAAEIEALAATYAGRLHRACKVLDQFHNTADGEAGEDGQ